MVNVKDAVSEPPFPSETNIDTEASPTSLLLGVPANNPVVLFSDSHDGLAFA